MSKEYCPDCSVHEIEEYDPVSNWRVPEYMMAPEILTPKPVLTAQIALAPPASIGTETIKKFEDLAIPKRAPAPPMPDIQIIKKLFEHIVVAPQKPQTPQADEKIIKYIKNYRGDLFNASAIFILKKADIPVTFEMKRAAHAILRDFQLESLNISQNEYEGLKVDRVIRDAIKKYDKSFFNLSPVWALQMSKDKKSVGNLLHAMKTIDSFI